MEWGHLILYSANSFIIPKIQNSKNKMARDNSKATVHLPYLPSSLLIIVDKKYKNKMARDSYISKYNVEWGHLTLYSANTLIIPKIQNLKIEWPGTFI